MKHLFLTALLFTGIATLISCNNGDYLADPQGSIPAPPGLDGVEEGIISCTVDSSHKYFRYGMWVDMAPAYVLSGLITKNKVPVEAITITLSDFKGTGTYPISDTTFGNSIVLHKVDADTIPTSTYVVREREGWGAITVKEVSGNTIKGEFNALAYRLDSAGAIIREDTVMIRKGRFNVSKK